jgi:hypothetical protein
MVRYFKLLLALAHYFSLNSLFSKPLKKAYAMLSTAKWLFLLKRHLAKKIRVPKYRLAILPYAQL